MCFFLQSQQWHSMTLYNLHIRIIFIPVSPFASTNDEYTHAVSVISKFSKQYMLCALLYTKPARKIGVHFWKVPFGYNWCLVVQKHAIKGEANSTTGIQMFGQIAVFYLSITMRQTRLNWISEEEEFLLYPLPSPAFSGNMALDIEYQN